MDNFNLYVSVDTSWMSWWNACGLVHLHLLNQILWFATSFVSELCVFVENKTSQSQQEHGNDGESIRPRDDIELWIHQPIATISIHAEDQDSEEKENWWRCDGDEGDRCQEPFVTQSKLQWIPTDFASHDSQSNKCIDESESNKGLNSHQPARQKILANDIVFLKHSN